MAKPQPMGKHVPRSDQPGDKDPRRGVELARRAEQAASDSFLERWASMDDKERAAVVKEREAALKERP